MDATHLPSGTVYPILRRLNAEGYVRSRWEKEARQTRAAPPRRYYELTSGGTALANDSASWVRQMAQAAARLTPAKNEI